MSAEFLTLAYTILAGLVGIAFFLGRLSSRVDTLKEEYAATKNTVAAIFAKLDRLTEIAIAGEAWRREHMHQKQE